MTDRADIHERTRRTLSREFDEPGACTKDSVKRARAHLGRCPQCRAFEAGLASGQASGAVLPDEHASDDLITRILGAAETQRASAPAKEETVASRAAVAAAEPVATPAPRAETPESPRPDAEPRPRTRRAGGSASHRSARGRSAPPWLPRFALGVTAAAAVVALFVGARLVADNGGVASLLAGRGITSGSVAGNAELAAPGAPTAQDGALGGADKAAGAASGAAQSSASGASKAATATPEPMTAPVPAVVTPYLGPGAAPGYVAPVNALVGQPVFLTFGVPEPYRGVWRFSGWLRNTPANILIKVGSVKARLGAGGRPVARPVYERIGDSTRKFVWWSADDYQVYRPATISPDGLTATYTLASDRSIPDWGVWPTWPSGLAPYPTRGFAPGAAAAGTRGATVYAVGSVPVAEGVAAPPGSLADPVARIPKWTWWTGRWAR